MQLYLKDKKRNNLNALQTANAGILKEWHLLFKVHVIAS